MQFLLPMYGIEFEMAELTIEIRLTRQSIAKAMKKFFERGMVKIRKKGRTWLYSINEESPLVKRLEDFDNSLIESMVGLRNSKRSGRQIRELRPHALRAVPVITGQKKRAIRN